MLKTIQEIQSNHTIVCDNEYLQELGLGSFTSGELYAWITAKNNKNEYFNLNSIRNPEDLTPFELSDPPKPEEVSKVATVLLGGYKEDKQLNTLDDYEFVYWQKGGRTGEWIKTSIAEYPNLPCSKGGRGSFLFDKFNNEKINIPDYTKVNIDYDNNKFYYDNQESDLFNDIAEPSINLDQTVCNLIEMNNYARYAKTVAAEDFWKKTDSTSDKYSYVPETITFIRDIQTSRNRYIEWSGIIPFAFYSNAFDVSGCIKESWVKYKLFLYNLPKETVRKVSINNPVIIQKPQNAFGQIQNITTTDQQEVPAPLSLTYDSISNKYESGTQQSLAIMVSDLQAAQQESIDFLLSQPIAFINSPTNSIGTTVGYALPITIQDGNPIQWSPLLANPNSDDTTKKNIVKVFNPTRNSFKKNDMVMLQKLNGVWVPSPLDVATKTEINTGFIGNWDFTYLMTNSLFYFITKPVVNEMDNEYKLVSYSTYERSFKSLFYKNKYDSDLFKTLDPYGFYKSYYAINENAILDLYEDGYLHITSWDFMRKAMGGTRDFNNDPELDYNILGQIVTGIDIEENEVIKYRNNPGDTDPFFGCAFPDGYDETSVQAVIEVAKQNTPIKVNEIISPNVTASFPFIELNYSPYLLTFPNSSGFFEDKCKNTSSDNRGSFHGIKQEKYTLTHLPADIATNCAPSNISNTTNYGSPITNRVLFHKYMTASKDNSAFDPEAFFNSNINYFWLHRDDDKSLSFLNLMPRNPKRIQFKPLKMETYASFDGAEPGNIIDPIIAPKRDKFLSKANNVVGLLGVPDGSSENDGPYFNKLVYKRAPSLNTNRKVTTVGEFSSNSVYEASGVKTGLSYGFVDMWQSSLGDLTEIYSDRVTGNFNNQIWQASQGFQGLGGIRSTPGVVGIIGASAKFKFVKDIISIKTENFFGTPPLKIVNINGTISQPTWGNSDDSYLTFMTASMWVRAFTSWPKHLTIYDPRYFSIFHFNEGVGQLNNKEIEVQELDLKWPTESLGCSPLTGKNQKTTIDSFDFLFFSNSEIEPKDKWIRREMSDPNHWYDGRHRRGKLLPYKYKKFSIGISTRLATSEADYKNDTSINIIEPSESSFVDKNTNGIFLVNRGVNYIPGDLLTTTGGSGSGVILKVYDIDSKGGITSLQVVDPGKDFSHTDFMKFGTQLNETSLKYDCAIQQKLGSVKLVNLEVKNNGEGVVGYVISGRIVSSDEIDTGPKEAILPTKITPSSREGENGMINEEYYSNISIINKSEDDTYDLFFHYHNDTSFVMSYYGTTYGLFDQFINLEIL